MAMEPEYCIRGPGDQFDAVKKGLEEYAKGEAEREDLQPFTIEWNDEYTDALAGLLTAAEEARQSVTVRFTNLEVHHITDVIFKYRSVRPTSDFDQSYQLTEDGSLIIGDQWSTKINEYTERRFVSLISEPTQDFVEELRNAIFAMKKGKERLDPPWDPVGKRSRISRPRGTDNPVRTLDPIKTPLLSDLFEMYDSAHERSSRRARELLDNGAATGKWGDRSVNLLVTGDSGTGKSLVAKLAHLILYGEDHQKRPFTTVNCGALDASSLQFKLFGGLPGSFTDITTAQVGTLSRAAYGTVFLDEFGDLPNDCQPFFLTYLQDLEITPAGGDVKPFYSYCYVIAATNRDLGASIRATEFRNDLVQRFARRVKIPSLRQRGKSQGEIIALIDMAAQHPDENPKEEFRGNPCRWVQSIAPEALRKLLEHDYADGNVRELESIVHRAIENAIRRDSDVVELEDLPQFGPSNFRPDAKRNVVRVSDLPEVDSQVLLKDTRDLDRIAQRSDRPILESESEYGVIVDNVLYHSRRQPDPED